MAASHEKLQSESHLFLHNEHPELRGLFHANFNGLPLILERVIPLTVKLRIMSILKAVGLVKGVLDYEFYYAGRLYMFDFKVDKDKLSKEQLEVGAALVKQGGAFCEIRSLEQFKEEIDCILTNGCLISEL